MRLISSAVHSARRRTSASCSGSALMLGNRKIVLHLVDVAVAINVDEVDDLIHEHQ